MSKKETISFFYDGENVRLKIVDGENGKGFAANLTELEQPQLELQIRSIMLSLWVLTDTIGAPVK